VEWSAFIWRSVHVLGVVGGDTLMGPPYFTGLRGGLFHISPLCQRSMLDFNPCNSFIGSYGSGYNIGLQREEALWHTTDLPTP